MTIHNTLSSTPLSTVANTPATEKTANTGSFANSFGVAAKSQQSAAPAQPTQPAAGTGLVGHLVNTTA